MSRVRASSGDPAAPRHVAGASTADGRRRRERRRAVVSGAGALALLAVVGTTVVLGTGSSSSAPTGGCADRARVLEVAAAPEIAPVLEAATRGGRGSLLPADAGCLQVRVTPRLAGEVLASVAAGGRTDVDLWVPDSSSWLSRLPAQSRPGTPLSLATSPAVLAVHRSTAETLGWPERPLVLAPALSGQGPRPLRLGLPRLDGSAATRLGLLEVSRALAAQPAGQTQLARAFRSAQVELPDDPAALLARVQADEALTVPVPEQVVWAHNDDAGSATVVAAYSPATSVLDYPLVPLAGARQEDVTAVRTALSGAAWSRRVQAAGFRTADGAAGPELGPRRGVDGRAAAGAAVPEPETVEAALSSYDVATRGTRMLAVLDISGSMAQSVPGLEGTRMDLATAAAGRGLGLLGDDAHVGLWVFSTEVTPTSDFRELVPIGPLATRSSGVSGREALAAALADVRLLPQGDTGLYDTVLAAVRHVRRGWDPERVNSVVVLTDGRNDDADGIGLEQLLAALRAEQGERPVPVIGVAYGPDTDIAAMRRISEATGGAVYTSEDPRRINQVVQDALSRRS